MVSELDFGGGGGRWAGVSSLPCSMKDEKNSVAERLVGQRGRLSLLEEEEEDSAFVSETEFFLLGQKLGREDSFFAASDSGSAVRAASEPSFLRVNQSPADLVENLIVCVSFLSMFPAHWMRLVRRLTWGRGER